eukprot:comp17969_c0_seq1/m.18330 comp17969_c0_seq1/g.18330  ORF comp17969_c0_seq1/g.18330 comp17969_c0_seq1/m.18330 type:complete len:214 (-) comp17969_c0_seq1:176-817(-)
MNVATLKRSAEDTHASYAKRHRGHLHENYGFLNKPHCGPQEPQGVEAVGCSHCGTVGQLSSICVVVSIAPIGARWPLAVSLQESLYTLKSKVVSMARGLGVRPEQLVVSLHGGRLGPGLDSASLMQCGIGPDTELGCVVRGESGLFVDFAAPSGCEMGILRGLLVSEITFDEELVATQQHDGCACMELDDREALLGRIHSLELELALVRSSGQ